MTQNWLATSFQMTFLVWRHTLPCVTNFHLPIGAGASLSASPLTTPPFKGEVAGAIYIINAGLSLHKLLFTHCEIPGRADIIALKSARLPAPAGATSTQRLVISPSLAELAHWMRKAWGLIWALSSSVLTFRQNWLYCTKNTQHGTHLCMSLGEVGFFAAKQSLLLAQTHIESLCDMIPDDFCNVNVCFLSLCCSKFFPPCVCVDVCSWPMLLLWW